MRERERERERVRERERESKSGVKRQSKVKHSLVINGIQESLIRIVTKSVFDEEKSITDN